MTASSTVPVIHRRGLMFVLSSPSGAGKSTISREANTLCSKSGDIDLTNIRPRR